MKTVEMIAALDVLSEAAFGRSRSNCISSGICLVCGLPKGEFRTAVAEAEYNISGMCQSCQDDFDNTFAEEE